VEPDRINKISQAIMAGTPAEKICKTEEEFKTYATIKSEREGWMEGAGLEMINDVP
jgi:hypothetical protein